MLRFIKLVDVIVMSIVVYYGISLVVDVVSPSPRWDSEICGLAAGAFAGVTAAKRFPRRDENADPPQVMK
jgi:hypothetical protein